MSSVLENSASAGPRFEARCRRISLTIKGKQMTETKTLIAQLRAIDLPAARKSRRARHFVVPDELVGKIIHVYQYTSVMAAYLEHQDKDAAEQLRAVARVLA